MPQTNEFAESLNDGRSVWLDGKRISNISTNKAFAGTLQTISDLLGLLDSKEQQQVIGFLNPNINRYVHKSFLIPRTLEDLIERREAFALWSKKTYGVMSRLSDYAYSLITGYYIDREDFNSFDPTFSEKIAAYYELAQAERRIITTAIMDPQIDRSKALEQRDSDAVLRIVKETEDGVIVKGAKMIATGAPYAHDVIVNTPYNASENQEEYANLFIVPLNAPGLQIVCRESFASQNERKHALSSRFDEMDAVLIFDDVFIPWERVLIKGSSEGAVKAHRHQQLNSLAHHQTVVRLLTKLQFIAGVATAIAQAIGADSFVNVQEKIGELYTQINSIEALLISSEAQGSINEKGVFMPARVPLQTARNLGTRFYPRAVDILKQIGAGGFTQLPSATIEDFAEELTPLLQKYYKGANVDAETKTAIFQIGWELVGSTLGSRHDLYERFYTGDPLRTYALQYDTYDKEPLKAKLTEFLNRINTETKEHSNEPYSNSLSATLK